MTYDELNRLPEFVPFYAEVHEVQPDGTVTLPNGQMLRGLVGKFLHVPRPVPRRVVSIEQMAMWRDADGYGWHTVMTDSGLMRERGP